MAIFVISLVLLALVRVGAILSSTNDTLVVHIGSQSAALVDLRQSVAISPYLFGANVFPEASSNSVDRVHTGFMNYGPPVADGLRDAKVTLMRFPGGNWGEEHLLSYDQLNAYSAFLAKTGAQGMIQARLSGSIRGTVPGLGSLTDRATLAGRWVDYMSNPQSSLRTGRYANAPFQPVRFWTVGNEPDLLVNPDTGKTFTVAEYVNAFVLFSTAMHQNNPTIQVFGPELSRFEGLGAGPADRDGQAWMEGFLKGVGAYERAHPELDFHLLDGISFHFYPISQQSQSSTALMSNAQAWNYLLEPVRQLARQSLNREAPIAITEINSNANKQSIPTGLAALWWADTLGALMNHEVQYVAFFSAEGVDSPHPLFTTKDLRPTAMLRVFELFSHLQHRLVPVASQRDPVSIYATQDDARQTVSLLLINKAPWPQLAEVRAQNRLLGVGSWADLDMSLAGYSITLFTLHRGSGAEAYTFKVPASDDASLAALTHTVCGSKTDALAHELPC